MHEHVLDPRLDSPLPKAGEILVSVDRKVPRAWARGEQLHRVGTDLGRSVERPLDPAVEEWASNSTRVT